MTKGINFLKIFKEEKDRFLTLWEIWNRPNINIKMSEVSRQQFFIEYQLVIANILKMADFLKMPYDDVFDSINDQLRVNDEFEKKMDEDGNKTLFNPVSEYDLNPAIHFIPEDWLILFLFYRKAFDYPTSVEKSEILANIPEGMQFDDRQTYGNLIQVTHVDVLTKFYLRERGMMAAHGIITEHKKE